MAAAGQHLWQVPGCPTAAQKHAPWPAPGRLLGSARRAYGWPVPGVLARARRKRRRTAWEERAGDWRERERECGRVVQGTGDCKINARVGVSATTRPSVSCRRVRACPATTRAPRTPDLNVASERGLERCKISARFCAARTRPSLRSTLKSGGRGGNTLCEEREASAASAGSHVRQEKLAFILQSTVQDFPERRFSLELVPHTSHLGL